MGSPQSRRRRSTLPRLATRWTTAVPRPNEWLVWAPPGNTDPPAPVESDPPGVVGGVGRVLTLAWSCWAERGGVGGRRGGVGGDQADASGRAAVDSGDPAPHRAHRKTIRRALASGAAGLSPPPVGSKLDPFREWIEEQLRADPRIPSQRLRELAGSWAMRAARRSLMTWCARCGRAIWCRAPISARSIGRGSCASLICGSRARGRGRPRPDPPRLGGHG